MRRGNGADGMTSFFCYGTLRHLPLLGIVLGRAPSSLDMAQAVLPDHAVYWAKDQTFPMIVAQAGAQAQGLLIRGLSDEDVARLDFYESGFDYDLSPVHVVTEDGNAEPAQVFFPDVSLWQPGATWSLTEWEKDCGPLASTAAIEVMDYFGVKSDDQIGRMFPMIQARAAARLNAAAGVPVSPSGLSRADVRISQHRRAYADFFALDEYDLSFRRFDGQETDIVKRAVFMGGDAAIVLPYDPVRDVVLLVEQMRMGPLGRGDPDVWQLEPVAGRLDAGETPQQTAYRETLEEAGVELYALENVADCYPSPGASSEFFYIYVGLADLPDKTNGTGGLDSENEDIRVHLIGFDALIAMLDRGHIRNAPLVLATLWLARHRDRLRNTA
jgi:nudix-type nucleoside diphosphatase (YffH/AdpP family)